MVFFVWVFFGVFSASLYAQSSSKEQAAELMPLAAEKTNPTQILEQIAQARQRIEHNAMQQRRACYQRFAVTGCLLQVERERRAELMPLRDQELALDAQQRKRRAEQRLATIAAKKQQAQDRQIEDSQRLLQAQTDQANKQEKQAQRLEHLQQDAQTRSALIQRKRERIVQRQAEYARRLQERAQLQGGAIPDIPDIPDISDIPADTPSTPDIPGTPGTEGGQ